MEFLPLKDFCDVVKGSTGISKAIPGEFPLVVTSEERSTHNEFQFDANAVIIPLVSSTGHGHASLKRIHYQEGKYAVGSILCAVIPKNPEVLNAEFLYHYLFLNKEKELVSRMKGMANVTLPMKEIEKIPIPILSIEEQTKFVEFYNSVKINSEEISTELTHQLSLISQLRQAFLREAMQGTLVSNETKDGRTGAELLAEIKAEKEQLVKAKKIKKQKPLPPISEDEIPFEIPENWVWCRLGEIGETHTGTTPSTLVREYFNGSIPFIKPADIYNNKINYSNESLTELGLKNGTSIPANSILMVCIGGSMGKCFYTDRLISCNQQINCITPIFCNLKLFTHILQSKYFQNLVKFFASGGATPIINRGKWEKILIPLPPLEIQERIVAKLDELMHYCDALEESVKESQNANNLLLQQVLREALEGAS